MVRKISFTRGINFFNSRPASSPFNKGIPTSTNTRSGFRSVAIFINARRSLTQPITSYSRPVVSGGRRKTWCGRQQAKWLFVSSMAVTLVVSVTFPSSGGRSSPGTNGTVAMILVPCHGFDSTENLPCKRCIRSCILSRPSPFLLFASSTSKPVPASLTTS